MKIALVHKARFPVLKYGGTERVVWWLAKGFCELKHTVALFALKGSDCPYADIKETHDFTQPLTQSEAREFDIVIYFKNFKREPEHPYLCNIGGNGKAGERFLLNTVFVSHHHAQRHHSHSFVYNGPDPKEAIFSDNPLPQLLFLAKTSWSVKNVKGAIQVAEKTQTQLKIAGGHKPFFSWPSRHTQWLGMIGGTEKAQVLSKSQALIFPILWNEPFGLAMVEAMHSGTPVIGTSFGSLPEIISPETGLTCKSYEEMYKAVLNVTQLSRKYCSEFSREKFNYLNMAKGYIDKAEKVLSGQHLSQHPPYSEIHQGNKLPFV